MGLNRVDKIDEKIKISNVLISVYDKTNMESLVLGFVNSNPNIRIYSTGGTYKKIKEILGNNREKHLIRISDYTRQPEMQGGLVKTLDFKIYLGLLSETYNMHHEQDLERTGGVVFDMVVVNLYPFEEVIKQSGVNLEDARANIDIGGPCMLRAAAKNFLRVLSVCNPGDYGSVLDELNKNNFEISLTTRFNYARKTFLHTAEYDRKISEYLKGQSEKIDIYDFQDIRR